MGWGVGEGRCKKGVCATKRQKKRMKGNGKKKKDIVIF
jgi:hypothetical protein